MEKNENDKDYEEIIEGLRASTRCEQGLVTTKEEAIKAVKYNGGNLRYLGEEFQNDKDVVMEALYDDLDAAHFIGNELKNNKEFILNIMKATDDKSETRDKTKRFPDDIKRQVLREILKDNDNSLKKDSDFLNEMTLVLMDDIEHDGLSMVYSMMDLLDKENIKSDEVKDKFDKLNKEYTPYYRVAKEALMEWNGLNEEEATKMINESSFDEIESQVYGKKSMSDGLKGMVKSMSSHSKYTWDKINDKELEDAIFDMKDDKCNVDDILKGSYITGFRNELDTDTIAKGVFDDGTSLEEVYIDGLSAIHDGWVEDNAKKFMGRDKKYQHLPIELIGWDEAKKDMLFLEPIISDENYDKFMQEEEGKLKEAYERKVDKYLEKNNINSKADLINLITRGSDFYSSLDGQDEITEALKDPKFVEENIVNKINPEIMDKINIKEESKNYEITDDSLEEYNVDNINKQIENEKEEQERLKGEIEEEKSKHEISEKIEELGRLKEENKQLEEELNDLKELDNDNKGDDVGPGSNSGNGGDNR